MCSYKKKTIYNQRLPILEYRIHEYTVQYSYNENSVIRLKTNGASYKYNYKWQMYFQCVQWNTVMIALMHVSKINKLESYLSIYI